MSEEVDCDTWFDAPSPDELPSTPRGRSPDSGIVAMASSASTSTSSSSAVTAAAVALIHRAVARRRARSRSASDVSVDDSGNCSDAFASANKLRRSVSSELCLELFVGEEDDEMEDGGEEEEEEDSGNGSPMPKTGWPENTLAEARLAARRAARAEARQIRLKEIERRKKEQKEEAEGTEDDSGAPVTPLSGASSSCGEPPPQAPAPPPMPRGGYRGSLAPSGTGSLSSGSRRSSQDSLNEEKELPMGMRELKLLQVPLRRVCVAGVGDGKRFRCVLVSKHVVPVTVTCVYLPRLGCTVKPPIIAGASPDAQEYRELEERFNKAMILNAQMDNEKSGLTYQVENLKDIIVELQESLLSLQKEYKIKSRDCDALRRAAESLKEDNRKLKAEIVERDKLINEVGLVMVYSEELDEEGKAKRALVTRESAQLLDEAGEGSLDVRIKRFAEEKNELQDTIRRLNLDLEEERSKNSKFTKLMASSPTTNGPSSTDEWIDYQKENNRLVAEYKARVQRSEQEILTLQANVSRLESQVTRYKTAAEAAEKNEEDLKLEKRKLLRELRESQEKLEEVETKRSHLEKRLEKVKNAKSALLKEISES
ncbi:unnamed protein product [Notodromas monacha]|uniref:Leucine-rich repeat flightless-interacting protein 2 n=1 Tax=Notodromas monacha TaxID=399045 RepID=A0A7R9BHC2_9CRUS|nr:unnamed protein product [Notodromas monacha]CAG0915511.1 unnamed protein product [Notodromas monacha]